MFRCMFRFWGHQGGFYQPAEVLPISLDMTFLRELSLQYGRELSAYVEGVVSIRDSSRQLLEGIFIDNVM